MKVDVDCTIQNGEAEIGISLLERVSRQEFEEYVDTLKREGFMYDPYEKSYFFKTKSPKMLSAMFRFFEKEFEVSANLKGKNTYAWKERDQFVKEFAEPASDQQKDTSQQKDSDQ
ncbi:MAG: hypothetical protein HXS46_07055 [Theionarchaea archaeon]|nr:MAG: hypothetical protein AYK18_03470 [Theionarchaea archaeon DG-70]MBU7010432.1 hypothetical protein [Theionarchaea archaeon]